MKKIEKRTFVCLALTLVLLLGLGLFVLRFFLKGGDWASFAANRHLYNSNGSLAVGRVLDRDGDVLSWVDESGNRQYYENATVRKATLHAVGDLSGSIGTSALVAFADQLSGYNFLTGADNPFGQGNDLYLTLDARLNYIAYQAMNGKKGAVGVYILPDDRAMLSRRMAEIADENQAELILTTGGTGFSPRDVMPEATEDITERKVPGIPEAIRAYSMTITKRAMLSRATAGIRKKTLIINLPGSPKAVKESLEYIIGALGHGIEIMTGESGNCARQ